MALYSDKVMDHFMNPRNVGKLDNPSGVGQVGNARCGDIMKIYIQVEDGVITDVKFNTFGCASAIASSSMATELIKGKPIDQALALTNQAVAEALDGLPAIKMHCSVLAEEAIKAAESGVQYIAQPGGSVRDGDVIACCDDFGMAMAMTGIRLFHH